MSTEELKIIHGDMLEVARQSAVKGRITVIHAFSSEDSYLGGGQLCHLMKNTDLSEREPPEQHYPIGPMEVRGFLRAASMRDGTEMFFAFVPAPKWDLLRLPFTDKVNLMKKRFELMLGLADQVNVEHLVLGAWGCGIYGVPPRVSAEVQLDCLKGRKTQTTFAFIDRLEALAFQLELKGRR